MKNPKWVIKMCKSKVNVKVPDNIIIRYNRPERDIREYITIDRCLVDTIKELWAMDIVTTGCCCGHGIRQGYIGVLDKHIPQMKKLGYEVLHNPHRPQSEDSFKVGG